MPHKTHNQPETYFHVKKGFTCPACGARLNALTPSSASQTPVASKKGDVSLCLECACVIVMGDSFETRMATPADLDLFTLEDQVLIARAVYLIKTRIRPN